MLVLRPCVALFTAGRGREQDRYGARTLRMHAQHQRIELRRMPRFLQRPAVATGARQKGKRMPE